MNPSLLACLIALPLPGDDAATLMTQGYVTAPQVCGTGWHPEVLTQVTGRFDFSSDDDAQIVVDLESSIATRVTLYCSLARRCRALYEAALRQLRCEQTPLDCRTEDGVQLDMSHCGLVTVITQRYDDTHFPTCDVGQRCAVEPGDDVCLVLRLGTRLRRARMQNLGPVAE